MLSDYIWVEYPTKMEVKEGNQTVMYEVRWHDASSLDMSPDETNDIMYVYLRRVVMHEFGHTAGLVDLDRFGNYHGSLWTVPPTRSRPSLTGTSST